MIVAKITASSQQAMSDQILAGDGIHPEILFESAFSNGYRTRTLRHTHYFFCAAFFPLAPAAGAFSPAEDLFLFSPAAAFGFCRDSCTRPSSFINVTASA